jgi:stigma-specific protein Stig1
MLRSSLILAACIVVAATVASSCGKSGERSGDREANHVAETCPAAGQHMCNGTCVSMQGNPDHCGACGNVCSAAQVCLSTGCAGSCPEPLSACDRRCVDRSRDSANCGRCGHTCEAGNGCLDGACVPAVADDPDDPGRVDRPRILVAEDGIEPSTKGL